MPVYKPREKTIRAVLEQEYRVEVDWFFGIFNPKRTDKARWGQNLVY